MNFTRRILLSCALGSVLAGGAFAQDADRVLKVGLQAEAYAPFSVKGPDGKWTGWEVDVMNALCDQMKAKCEIVETAWDGIIPALNAKQIDMIMASMTITAERKETIDFSTMYYNTPNMIIGPKNGDKDITPDHLKGKTIGVQTATIHQRYAEKYFPGSEIKAYKTLEETTQDLNAGRLDYAFADSATLSTFMNGETGKACCEIKGIVSDDPAILGEGVGVGVRKDDTVLRDRISAAIAAMASAGTFVTITEKYPDLKSTVILPGAAK